MNFKLDLSEKIIPLDNKIISDFQKKCFEANFYARKEDYEKTQKLIAKYANVRTDNVVIVDGSHHGLETIFFLFNNSDEVIIPVPTFSLFTKYEDYQKFKIKKIYYDKEFNIDTNKIIKSIGPKTKAIYIVNPHNPLGITMNNQNILKIIQMSQKRGVIVILDEAYYEFSTTTAKKFLKKYNNIIISRSFSKSFGIAGTKMGYILTSPKIKKELEYIRGPFFGLSRMNLLVADSCLKNVASMKKYVKEIREGKKKLEEFLKENKIKFFKSGTNFLVFKIKGAKKLVEALAKENILVKYLGDYPDNNGILKNCIRMSVPPKEKMDYFLRKFKKVIKGL